MSEDSNLNNLGSVESSLEQSVFKQSANAVFHFTDKLEFVEEILKKSQINPRYVIEDMEYLNYPLFSELAIPMICFCDIKLHSLIDHVDFYGHYGIGFNKTWIIKKGIQPIHYLNPRSHFSTDYQKELLTLQDSSFNLPETNKDYIFKKLSYFKPLEGMMTDKTTKQKVKKNFHDENEWRYIPKFIEDGDFKPFIPVGGKEPIHDGNYRRILNKALSMENESAMHFTFDDIKYLFVKDRIESLKLIEFIFSELDQPDALKRLLVSKIQIIHEIKEDY